MSLLFYFVLNMDCKDCLTANKNFTNKNSQELQRVVIKLD